jgi:hypothetical protein
MAASSTALVPPASLAPCLGPSTPLARGPALLLKASIAAMQVPWKAASVVLTLAAGATLSCLGKAGSVLTVCFVFSCS